MKIEEAQRIIYDAMPSFGSEKRIEFLGALMRLKIIKFDDFTEDDEIMKEAEAYLNKGQGYRLDDVGMYYRVIQGLYRIVKENK